MFNGRKNEWATPVVAPAGCRIPDRFLAVRTLQDLPLAGSCWVAPGGIVVDESYACYLRTDTQVKEERGEGRSGSPGNQLGSRTRYQRTSG
tara:strand:+ start:925 stop:1197 length:273 start_codon:yes stop_codon:yes gene_type:complete